MSKNTTTLHKIQLRVPRARFEIMQWAVSGLKLKGGLGEMRGAVEDLTYADAQDQELLVDMDGIAIDGNSTYATLKLTDVDVRAPGTVLAGILDIEPKGGGAKPSMYPLLLDRIQHRRSGLVELGGFAISGRARSLKPTCGQLRAIVRDCYQEGLPSFT